MSIARLSARISDSLESNSAASSKSLSVSRLRALTVLTVYRTVLADTADVASKPSKLACTLSYTCLDVGVMSGMVTPNRRLAGSFPTTKESTPPLPSMLAEYSYPFWPKTTLSGICKPRRALRFLKAAQMG